MQRFQSLGRDSVGLDVTTTARINAQAHVSIPRSGFCWFGHVPAIRMIGA